MTTVSAPARTQWTLDPTHTSVEFSVRHMMITSVKGRFTDVQGSVVLDEARPEESQVEVTMAAASIDTRQPQRDEHLRSADFFDAATFPTLTFRSRSVQRDGDDLTLIGDLTIRGVTQPVVLKVASHGRQADPWGGERAGFEATGKIKRSDFGLTWNQALETGGVLVGDEVKITIDAQLVRL